MDAQDEKPAAKAKTPKAEPAPTTFWLKAKRPFHISSDDRTDVDPTVAGVSRGLATGERCEVKDNKRTRGLISGGLADEV